eukprot:795188-Rhodomonas_salina.3
MMRVRVSSTEHPLKTAAEASGSFQYARFCSSELRMLQGSCDCKCDTTEQLRSDFPGVKGAQLPGVCGM